MIIIYINMPDQIFKPRFELGKIKSKYIIADILAYACENKVQLCILLHSTSKQMRCLLIEGYNWIKKFFFISPFIVLLQQSSCEIYKEDVSFFDEIIQNVTSVSLLYRGSRDGWMYEDFHRMCDKKDHTITFF